MADDELQWPAMAEGAPVPSLEGPEGWQLLAGVGLWRKADGLLCSVLGYPAHLEVQHRGQRWYMTGTRDPNSPEWARRTTRLLDALFQVRLSFSLMDLAELVSRQAKQAHPNPMVGCVIVAPSGQIIGAGHTSRPGEGHAEVNAIASVRRAGRQTPGSILVSTLEPCCHHGRTPPCTDAILGEPWVDTVVAMAIDPNPVVNGAGMKQLREAGLLTVLCERQT